MQDYIKMALQVAVSIGIIWGVIWWLWRLPGKPVHDSDGATLLAFTAVWLGVGSVILTASLWFVQSTTMSEVLTPVSVGAWAAAIASGAWSLWTYRHTPPEQMEEAVQMQRLQARIGIILGFVAVVMWYAFVSHSMALESGAH